MDRPSEWPQARATAYRYRDHRPNEGNPTMSLNWNLSKMADHHGLHNTAPKGEEAAFPKGSPEDLEGDFQWAITETLIWATIWLGMSSITEANWQRFATRLRLYENAFGATMRKDGEDWKIRPEDVHRRIGLSTNASPLTEAAFRKRVFDRLMREAESAVSYAAKSIGREVAA